MDESKKVVTVNLNPCIDRTLCTEIFQYGGTSRLIETREDVSGKGINTNVVLQNLGIKNVATGFTFSDSGTVLQDFLDDRGIERKFINVPGPMRVNYKIFERVHFVMSEINSGGTQVDLKYCEEMLSLLEQILRSASILVLSGSIPPGVPERFYGEAASLAGNAGVPVIADCSGNMLLETIKERPLLIKPNVDEFRKTFHTTAEKDEELVYEANKIIEKGVKYVCISKGEDGALLISRDKIYKASPIPVEIKGIQGAGDSMVAGFCYAIMKDYKENEYLRYAVAAATCSLIHEGTQLCEKNDLEQIKELVQLKENKNGG